MSALIESYFQVRFVLVGQGAINVDADTGGYNLQAAFSIGWLARRSAGEDGCAKIFESGELEE
jgi:hypothetical protein